MNLAKSCRLQFNVITLCFLCECVYVSNYQSQNLPALLHWTSCTVHTTLSLLATFNPSFCTVSLWKSMCLNSAAKTPNSAKKHMTRIHSHIAAAERNPVLWRTNMQMTIQVHWLQRTNRTGTNHLLSRDGGLKYVIKAWIQKYAKPRKKAMSAPSRWTSWIMVCWKFPRIEIPMLEMKPSTRPAVFKWDERPKSRICWNLITTIHRANTQQMLHIWANRQLWGVYAPHVLM